MAELVAFEIRYPHGLAGDRLAREYHLEYSDGTRQAIANNATEQQRLIKALALETVIPARFERVDVEDPSSRPPLGERMDEAIEETAPPPAEAAQETDEEVKFPEPVEEKDEKEEGYGRKELTPRQLVEFACMSLEDQKADPGEFPEVLKQTIEGVEAAIQREELPEGEKEALVKELHAAVEPYKDFAVGIKEAAAKGSGSEGDGAASSE